jgi:hypothetical protein
MIPCTCRALSTAVADPNAFIGFGFYIPVRRHVRSSYSNDSAESCCIGLVCFIWGLDYSSICFLRVVGNQYHADVQFPQISSDLTD